MAAAAAATAASMNSGPRRAATMPAALQKPVVDGPAVDPSAETLFVHPGAKIVSFSVPATPGSSTGAFGSPNQAGTLPWKRNNERVVAVGPIRIYRVPGSVSFIVSGDLVLSLLPRSQCWCVDGDSKFAMSLKGIIYRIELPNDTEEDKALVEEWKEVLGKVIKYEKTPCPFRREFTVDGVDEPDSPIPLGPKWSHIKERQLKSIDAARVANGEVASKVGGEGSSAEVSEEDENMSVVTEESNLARTSALLAKQEDDTKPPIRPRVKDKIRVFSSPLETIVSNKVPSKSGLTGNDSKELLGESSAQSKSLMVTNSLDSPQGANSEEQFVSEASPDPSPRGLNHTRVRPTDYKEDPFVDTQGLKALSHQSVETAQAESPESDIAEITNTEATQTTGAPTRSSKLADTDAPTFIEVESVSDLPRIPTPDQHVLDIRSQQTPSTPEAVPESEPKPPTSSTLDLTNPLNTADLNPTMSKETLESPNKQSPSKSTSPTSPQTSPQRRARRSNNTLSSPPPRVGIISRTAAILMGPPSGLIQILMQIASRIARGAAGGGAYRFRLNGTDAAAGRRVHLGRRYSNLPGKWEDSEDDGADSVSSAATNSDARRSSLEEDEWSEAYSDEEDDYGVSLRNDETGRARRRKWSASERGEWDVD